MVLNKDVFDVLPTLKDNSISFVFSDPPYNMGSKYRINPETGKPQEVILSEFMGDKWNGLTCEQLEIFFKECFRICKYGAYVVLYGIDRVQMPFEYFAQLAGFEPQQYLYSFKISSFPKAMDIGKAIDKKEGAEREIIGKKTGRASKPVANIKGGNYIGYKGNIDLSNITSASSFLAKKYDGYKASISPFKQVLETILIFKKPYPKGMSNIDAIYQYEEGNKEIHPSLINIEGGRVPTEDNLIRDCIGLASSLNEGYKRPFHDVAGKKEYGSSSGRYPAQLFIVDDERLKEEIGYNTSDILDRQSGVQKSSDSIRHNNQEEYSEKDYRKYGKYKNSDSSGFNDIGGASRILHKCNFTEEEYILQDCLYAQGNFDILTYCTKVSGKERDAGCEELEDKERFGQGNYSQSPICKTCNKTINGTNNHDGCSGEIYYSVKEENLIQKNNHPTLKSLELNKRICCLFTTVKGNLKDFTVFNPFSGTRSEYIGLLSNGVLEENIIGCELNSDYFLIGEKREQYWKEHNFKFMKEERKELEKTKKEVSKKKEKTLENKEWFI